VDSFSAALTSIPPTVEQLMTLDGMTPALRPRASSKYGPPTGRSKASLTPEDPEAGTQDVPQDDRMPYSSARRHRALAGEPPLHAHRRHRQSVRHRAGALLSSGILRMRDLRSRRAPARPEPGRCLRLCHGAVAAKVLTQVETHMELLQCRTPRGRFICIQDEPVHPGIV